MRRGWVVLLGIGLPIAALALAVTVMESARGDAGTEPRAGGSGPGGPSPRPDVPDAAPDGAEARRPIVIAEDVTDETPRLRRGGHDQPMVWDSAAMEDAPTAKLVTPPGAVPGFVSESSEKTELYRGYSPPGWVTFGLSADGTIRMVDVDGGRFEGKLDGTRATMRAARATSSFDLEFVTHRGRRQVSFRGGRHDARKLELEPVRRRTTR